ncbi:3-dehydroquinate synthase [Rhodoligotrophos appendicifer]|uniref:3-dehydroquinate synthase n=1 Tax=Rhodoligotrophos appendicifer TaxID=987056 RepID=UPI001180B2FE|nr:3-dehydroquinate synthase [Rhodoligotrophos appendicifer]
MNAEAETGLVSPTEVVGVELGRRRYDIHIGSHLLERAGELVEPILARPRTAIVTDETVAELHLRRLQEGLSARGIEAKAIVLPAGERSKSFATLEVLCDGLLQAGIERRDHVIALGGGVMGDLVGFAAAILRRGVRFIQIPTTLLAQVDSSVGGKTGINAKAGKNLIGAFHQPDLVIADTSLLDTLPPRQFRAGYAEVVKYGLLGDRGFYDWLDAHLENIVNQDGADRLHAIATCCRAKAEIVVEDEFETGRRALLNLGHTFGHALEAATGYSDRLIHGEAVAIGTAQAFRFSERLGLCAGGTALRVETHLRRAGLPIDVSAIPGDLPGAGELVEIMRQDKKAIAGKLTFILVRGIGEAFVSRDVDEGDVRRFLEEELAGRQSARG